MTATLLPTGAVLLAGGTDTKNFLSSAELYVGSPPAPIVLIVPGIFGTKLASTSQVVWLSNESIYYTSVFGPQELEQLAYNSSGSQVVPLSVQAIHNGTDYGGLFDLSSEYGNLEYELACTPLILKIVNATTCHKDFYTYNALVQTLASNGFISDVFPYDWRGDIAQIAGQLNQEVNSLIAQYPGRPISVVAHSMGGLVVGEMLATYGVSPAISHVITLGAPFLGSVESYFEFRGWSSFYPYITGQVSAQIGGQLDCRI